MRTTGHDAFVAVTSDAALAGRFKDGEGREGGVGTGVAVGRENAGEMDSRGGNIGEGGFDIAEVVIEA